MISIKNLTRGKTPGIPFELITNDALGKDYDLSLVFVGDVRMRKLNRTHRGKDKPTNVLSFPLSKTEGEMFLDLNVIRREAKREGQTFSYYLAYIFIHGLFHLDGLDHGSIMDQKEKALLDSWHEKLSPHST